MKPLRAPWQVWGVVALAPMLWLLYQAPGDPSFSDPAKSAGWIGLALVMLLWGSKLAWALATASTGAVGLILTYLLFEPSDDPGAVGVLLALIAASVAQFALFISHPTMDWVGVKDRRAATPPAAPTT